MELLEREHDLQVLVTALEQAIAGRGRVVLVSGEAGIGKSSLVEHFIQTHGQTVRILKGNCDALFTPTPLGPLYDIARQIGGKLSAQLESNASRAAIFFTLLDQLCDSPQPTLLAIEDIHWADETTLDLTKVLSRRVSQMKVLLIVTYRDDDIGVQHKLRAMLGDMLTSNATVRIELSRLTVEAARIMIADRLFDPQALHRQTSGNPFFISEIISSGAPGIPKTVRDAVLARVVKLEPAGRKVLEAAAVLGSKIEHRMLERLVGGGEVEGLAECMKIGLIVEAGDCVAFRHELMREAVLTDLDPGCRRQLNQLALEALKSSTHRRSDLAQLAHYAEGAGNAEAVLEHGLAAAQAASSFGAHREAAAQYVRVLRYVSNQPLVDRAQLLEAYAEECVNFDELTQAIDARREAIELWRTAGDRVKEGQNLALLAWPLIRSGQNCRRRRLEPPRD